jgi:hypothetical protein
VGTLVKSSPGQFPLILINNFHEDFMFANVTYTPATFVVKPPVPVGAIKSLQSLSTLLTVAQFSQKHPAFSQNAIRAHIYGSKPRNRSLGSKKTEDIPANGLAAAICHVGRRVLLNEERYLCWIETGKCFPEGA